MRHPIGQPQGIAPTKMAITPINMGQPQGIAPTKMAITPINIGQPQGIAPTKMAITPINMGQPQGIAPISLSFVIPCLSFPNSPRRRRANVTGASTALSHRNRATARIKIQTSVGAIPCDCPNRMAIAPINMGQPK
ncbi:MAG: hypothetical protein R3D00_19910 [Bacteroidia bacterium]